MMEKIIICFIAFVICLTGWIVYDEIKSDKFYLRKDSWHCTINHVETTLMPITTGNSTTYVTQVHSVCDQWSKNGG